jgi:inosine-uridine nucleoside N-ribohydrolase
MKTKILLDTDIGSDIDDAVCLAYLLAQPDCDLLGITTVTGEPTKRAMLASALCKVAGKQVPIYPGIENPWIVPPLQPLAPQAVALDRWDHETTFPQGEAVEFLRRTIRANPGEVVLLPIGPLTNIGTLFTLDPEIPRLLKGLVLMCGVFTERFEVDGQAEWNARLDPQATEVVYRARPPLHRSVGLDVTMQTVLPIEDIRQRFTFPLLRPVLDFAEVWFQHSQHLVFHDPLAATTIFDDGICKFQRGSVQVDSILGPGRTRWKPDEDGPHEVAIEVDVDRFYLHYFSTLSTP